jgi:hypothetical protein
VQESLRFVKTIEFGLNGTNELHNVKAKVTPFSPTDDSGLEQNGLSLGVYVGIAAAVLALIAACLAVLILRRRKDTENGGSESPGQECAYEPPTLSVIDDPVLGEFINQLSDDGEVLQESEVEFAVNSAEGLF